MTVRRCPVCQGVVSDRGEFLQHLLGHELSAMDAKFLAEAAFASSLGEIAELVSECFAPQHTLLVRSWVAWERRQRLLKTAA